MIGRTVSRYRIVDLLGEGGMGVVYRAEDESLGRSVALKFLPWALSRDEGARARFLNEARAASTLDHRNVCAIHDIGETDDGRLFIVMPCYVGESLEARIDRGALPPADAVDVLCQVATGLATAHEQGILHRDLKPGNVFLTDDGEAKILDFGVAKLADGANLTRSGGVVGTLAYMSPEQLQDEGADVRSEVWALGVILYEMLTASAPFSARSQAAVVTAILHDEPDLDRVRRIAGAALAAVVRRCLRRRPRERYASVPILLEDLERLQAAGVIPATSAVPAGEKDEEPREESLPTQDLLTPVRPRSRADVRVPPSSPSDSVERRPDRDSGEGSGSEIRDERPFSAVVGRTRELDALRTWLDEAADGSGRIALVRGEEGRGKSTLVAELCRRAEREAGFLTATGSCDAPAADGDPYLPFREILAQLSGERHAQEAAGRRTRARGARIDRLVPAAAAAIVERGPALIGTLISGAELLERLRERAGAARNEIVRLQELMEREDPDPPSRADLLAQVAAVVARVAEAQPLILVLEDLHRGDPASLELLAHLARALETSPVLMVGTYRHEEVTHVPGRERHPFEAARNELTRLPGTLEIDMDRGGERFVEAVLAAEPNRLGADFRQRLLIATGGHPLFVTELLRELADRGDLERDEEGRWTLARDVNWDRLPRRVEAVVAGRMSRLEPDLRGLLTAASVQGEEFVAEIVARVLEQDERDVLRRFSRDAGRQHQIVDATGVRRVSGHRQSLYRFRHAHFRRYLYGELDHVERALFHEDTATHMVATYGDRDDEIVARLAHHYREAGLAEEAIVASRRAAERAVRLSAHREAIGLYRSALEQLGGLAAGPDRARRELDLLTALASVEIAVHGFGSEAVESTYLRARDLCERLPEASDFPLLWGLFAFSSVRGELDRSLPIAHRMLEASRDLDDPVPKIQSAYAVGVTEFFLGRLDSALAHLEAAQTPRDPSLGEPLALAFSQDTRKVAAAYASWIRWIGGSPREALDSAGRAVRWAREDRHPFTLSTVLLLTGFVHLLAGDAGTVRDHGEEMARLSLEFEIFQAAEAELLLALSATCEAGATSSAEVAELLESAIDGYRGRDWAVFVPFLLGFLARAKNAAGDPTSAKQCLADAKGVVDRNGETFWLPEILRLQSEIGGLADDAHRDLADRAFHLASEQDARWLALRAAVSSVRLGGDRETLETALEGISDPSGYPEADDARLLLGRQV